MATSDFDRKQIEALAMERKIIEASQGNGRAEIRQTQISAQCTGLAEQSEILDKLVRELEERLDSILRPSNEERGPFKPEEGIPNKPLAPHADFLQTRVGLLRRVGNNLVDIIQRIGL